MPGGEFRNRRGGERVTIGIGERLPAATFLEMTGSDIEPVESPTLFDRRKVVLFAVPGAFTGTCSTRHVPSFMRVADALRAKGVDEIVCVAVNDPQVLRAWNEATGASGAGIRMLADAGSDFTRAIGMDFDNPARGMHARSKRYAMLVEDGVVRVLNVEASPGQCDISAGETMLAQI
jgi:cytochrome c peroxidase